MEFTDGVGHIRKGQGRGNQEDMAAQFLSCSGSWVFCSVGQDPVAILTVLD